MAGIACRRTDFLGRFQTAVGDDVRRTAKGFKMSDIVVEFSGWIVADPDSTMFFYVGKDDRYGRITGKQWLELDESERSDYVLDNVIDAQRHSLDGDYDLIDVQEREN